MSDIPIATIIHSHDPEKRRDILLRLKDAARKLTPFAHQQSSSVSITNAITAGNNSAYVQRLDEHVAEAYELCTLIEICLMNGIRIKEYQGVVPLWGLLERLATVEKLSGTAVATKNIPVLKGAAPVNNVPNTTSSFHYSVEFIARMTSLRTPVAKARAWIRYALNSRALDECLSIVLQEKRLVSLFYLQEAILSIPDNITILVAVIRTLKVLPFAFSMDDVSLNSQPTWIGALVDQAGYQPLRLPPADFPPVTGRSSTLNQRAPQKQRGIISSFFGSIERGINGVMESVDSIANRALDLDSKDGRDREKERDMRYTSVSPLFGTPLKTLILDDSRCGVSHMDPELGIPVMAACMISFLTINVGTPQLFRQKVTFERSEALRTSLEQEKGIPNLGNMSVRENLFMVHTVAFTLLQWLTELSEPLLGTLHYAALSACQDVEDVQPRIRNFSLLVSEAPWYNQPLLSKLLALLNLCLKPEHLATNGLNLVALSVLFTPLLYRMDPYLHHVREHPRAGGSFFCTIGDIHFVERDEEAIKYLSISAAGSCTVGFLILKESDILLPVRTHLSQVRTALASKVNRVRSLMDEVGVGVSVSSLASHWLEMIAETGGKSKIKSISDKSAKSVDGKNNSTMGIIGMDPEEGQTDPLSGVNENSEKSENNSDKKGEDKNENGDGNDDKSGNDNENVPRKDGVKEGEEKLFQMAFELHCALGLLVDARRNRLINGDEMALPAYSNTSHNCPSNVIRLKIESDYERKRKEKIVLDTLSSDDLNDIGSNIDKDSIPFLNIDDSSNNNSTDKDTTANSKTKKASACEIFGGISNKNNNKTVIDYNELEKYPTLSALYSSNRWGICGFQTNNPLHDFMSNGLQALKCTTEFLLRYEEAGADLGSDFAQQRSKFCTFAQVAVQLSKFTADALRLTPTPYTPLSAPIQHLAKQPSWQLLSEQNCFQEMFNLSVLTFDEAWRAVTEERGTLPNVNTYEQCMLYVREVLETLIKESPRTLDSLWSHWIALMESRRKEAISSFTTSSTTSTSTQKNSPLLSFGKVFKRNETASNKINSSDNSPNVKENSKNNLYEDQGTIVLPNDSRINSSVSTESSLVHVRMDCHDYTGIEFAPLGTPSNSDKEMHSSEISPQGDNMNSHLNRALPVGKVSAPKGLVSIPLPEGLSVIFPDTHAHTAVGHTTTESEAKRRDLELQDSMIVLTKSHCGIDTKVFGGSHILNSNHICQLEAALPETHQCSDWKLLYRLGRDGASLNTLLLRSAKHESCLLVVKDLNGNVFGGFITEKLKGGSVNFSGGIGLHSIGGVPYGPDKYYGNGTVAVWSFVSGALQYYPSANTNTYYLLSSPDSFAMGGGKNFALFMDGDLNKGSSGECETFMSACLSSSEEFVCLDCELFGFQSSSC